MTVRQRENNREKNKLHFPYHETHQKRNQSLIHSQILALSFPPWTLSITPLLLALLLFLSPISPPTPPLFQTCFLQLGGCGSGGRLVSWVNVTQPAVYSTDVDRGDETYQSLPVSPLLFSKKQPTFTNMLIN